MSALARALRVLAPKRGIRGAPDPLVSRLVLEAEIEAERTLSIVRIGIALILATWAFSVAGFGQQAAPTSGLPPGLVIGVLLLIGVASYALSGIHSARLWGTYLFAVLDAGVIATSAWLILEGGGLSGNWIPAVPPIWAVPLLLAVGALRYEPWALIWSTFLFIGSLLLLAFFLGFDRAGPTEVATSPGHLFALPPTIARALLLCLTGLVAALAVQRARSVLIRGVREATRRANLSRFLPAEIAPLLEPSEPSDWRKGRRQVATIMFVDIRNSTSRAEGLDPRRLSVLISSFRRRVLA